MTPRSATFWLLASTFWVSVHPIEATESKLSNHLIGKDYGIVTRQDLLYDDENWNKVEPYDPDRDTNGAYWQCEPIESVTISTRYWRSHGEFSPHDSISEVCELEIFLYGKDGKQVFETRRGHEASECREFLSNWNKLIRGQNIVCLNGLGSMRASDFPGDSYRLWTWVKLKTKKGCLAYFENDCQVAKYLKSHPH